LTVRVGGGSVDANGVGRQGVDANGLAVEVTFECFPGGRVTQAGQQIRETVVVAGLWFNRFAKQGGQSVAVVGDPGFDVVEAVVLLGEDEKHPDGEHFANGERPFPGKGWREQTVTATDEVDALQIGPDHGQIGNGFDAHQVWLCCVHTAILRTRPISKRVAKPRRTAGYCFERV